MNAGKLILLCFLLLCRYFTSGQTCPPNIDFEKETFEGWECFTGMTSVVSAENLIQLDLSGPMPDRHEIFNLSSLGLRDKYGNFPVLCPYGGNASVKLGNDGLGAQAEGISYTFTVPNVEDTFSFTYFYAVVFQDPSHSPIEQPRFFVTAYDVESGELINCASYNYIATAEIPGFKKSLFQTDVLYKEWSPVTIQFAGLANRKVRLEFKTADCTLGGHFGYAYIDVGSGCSNILASAPYCVGTNSVILNAPYGFKSYTWYNSDYSEIVGTGQSLKFSPAPFTTGTFYVDIVPYPGFGCRDTASATVKPTQIPDPPDTSSLVFCQYSYVNDLYSIADRGNDLIWYTDTVNDNGSLIMPTISTDNAGDTTFFISQKVLLGCESYRVPLNIKIERMPQAAFNINDALQCLVGNNYLFKSISSNISNGQLIWDFGDGTYDSSSVDSISHKFLTHGQYAVKLKVINSGTCTQESNGYVTVGATPVAAFMAPAVICENQLSVQLIDNSTLEGYDTYISGWWWDVDGNMQTGKLPTPISAGGPRDIKVRLTVRTSAGCASDTLVAFLPVRNKPLASFAYSSLLCDNEPLAFTDLSKMPAGSPDFVSKWYWQLDNGNVVGLKNPVMYAASGLHQATLVAESNMGCKSDPFDSSMFLHPKPNVSLVVNDSCVRKLVTFQAISRLPNVANWYWNLGNGMFESGSLRSETYRKETQFPVTLIGKTDQGCKDTAFRAFRIFENFSNAGRDTIVAKNEPVRLNAGGGSGVHYYWSPAFGLNDASLEKPVATLATDQLYKLYAVSDQGCETWSEIFIKRYEGPELYIPNAFTPNSDGKNDLLKVFPVGIRKFHYLAVYNRNGQLVYRTTDYTQGWNGFVSGTKMLAGTYVAVAQAEDYNGKAMMKKTAVVLVR